MMLLPRPCLSRSLLTLAASALLVGGLSACAPVVVGTAAVTGAAVAFDRRTAGEQLDDQTIEFKIASEVRKLFPNTDVRINATSYSGEVLLTGDVPTQADRVRAETELARVERVRRIINRLRVGDITPLSMRSDDTWLTSKVRTNLINTKDVPSTSIVITTERGTVYLMGRVTRAEAERSARVAANVNGVNQVVTLFEVVSPERIAAPADKPPAPAPAANPVRIMPVQ